VDKKKNAVPVQKRIITNAIEHRAGRTAAKGGVMPEDLQEFADDHGYQQYRCPGCHKLYYSDSGPVGNCPCGYMPEGEEDEDGE